jgi:hypothetical protein
MKRAGKIAICLAGGLALCAGLRAADPASTGNPAPDNPYASIVIRNIFGLVPPPPPPDPNIQQEASLPKITPTGIMSFFGHSKVLFKVAGAAAKPGQPAKDAFYTLSQGQRQDDIEIIKIDDKNNLVTFNNHGITQELPLVSAPASGGAAAPGAPGAAGIPGMMPGAPGGVGNNGPGALIRIGGGSAGINGGSGAFGGGGMSGGGGGGPNNVSMNFGNAVRPNAIYQPMQENPPVSPEVQIIQIEAERAALMNDPHPAYPPALLPPTPLTKFNTPDGSIQQ